MNGATVVAVTLSTTAAAVQTTAVPDGAVSIHAADVTLG
jgi:hypothetical protein